MEADRRAEAWDAARGWVLFAGMVAALGAVAGLAGWVAGNIETAGIVVGCAVLSAIVAMAMRGLFRWGIDEPVAAKSVVSTESVPSAGFRRAA